jgi:hypothetical protein
MALPIFNNIDGLTFKNNKQFETLTSKVPFRIEEKANFNTNLRNRAGRNRSAQELEIPIGNITIERTRRDTEEHSQRKKRQIVATGLVA